jgi:hypothetical protein
MGVDYNVCDHCGDTYGDCGDYRCFEITGLDDTYSACSGCMGEVQGMLIPDEDSDYLWFVRPRKDAFKADPSLKRHIFRGSKKGFQEWCLKAFPQEETAAGSIHKFQFSVGSVLEDKFARAFQDMWQNDDDDDSKVVKSNLADDVQRTIETASKSKSWSRDYCSIRIAWLGHGSTEFSERSNGIQESINRHIRSKGLEDVPCVTDRDPRNFMLYGSVAFDWYASNKAMRDAGHHVCTDWYDTLEDCLGDAGSNMPTDHVEQWKASREMIDHLADKWIAERDTLDAKIKSCKDLYTLLSDDDDEVCEDEEDDDDMKEDAPDVPDVPSSKKRKCDDSGKCDADDADDGARKKVKKSGGDD